MRDEAGATVGVILAGGLARRLGGGDKPLSRVGGRTILSRIVARVGPQCDALLLSANGDPARLADIALPVVSDTLPDRPGPLAGILAGLDWAAAHRPDADLVLSVPGDCPFLPLDLVPRLRMARAASGTAVAVAASGGRTHPVVALWPVALRDALRRALTEEGMRKVGAFVARSPHVAVDWPTIPLDPFFNANTSDDLAEAEHLATRLGA